MRLATPAAVRAGVVEEEAQRPSVIRAARVRNIALVCVNWVKAVLLGDLSLIMAIANDFALASAMEGVDMFGTRALVV